MDCYVGVALVLLLCVITGVETASYEGSNDGLYTGTSKIAGEILQFYSQDKPKGIPAVCIPDPLSLPLAYNLTTSLSISDQEIEGLSQILLHTVVVDFSNCKLHAEARIPRVNLLGQYLWLAATSWSDDTYGITNITMQDVDLTLDAQVDIDKDGALWLDRNEIKLRMSYKSMSMDFQNLSSAYSFVARVAFPAFLPSLLYWVEDWLHETLSYGVRFAAPIIRFPDSLPCLDFMLIQVRSYIRKSGLDPLLVPPLWIELGSGFSLMCEETVVSGLATLHRVQDLQIRLIDDTVILLFQIGTQSVEMTGVCGIPYVSFLSGPLNVLVDSITITVELHQRTHLRSPPTLRVLKIGIGNIEIRSSAIGTMDYLVEAVANVVPNLLRSSIVEKLEPLLWKVLQEHLSSLDMRGMLIDQLIKQEKVLDQSGYSA